MPKTLFKNYVSNEGENRIKEYKYKCDCDSIVYGYIMGPLANFSLQFTPESLAPNTITFIAFLFNLIPHLLMLSYTGEDIGSGVPAWLCVFAGLSQFIYMHFDNMDGKQARRTGSSSSLGMLYDHGLDSVSGWIMAMNLACAIRIESSFVSTAILTLVPCLGFYYTMWEEYNLDFLHFGKINPVDEGLTFLNIVIIFAGIVGGDWFLEEVAFGIKRNMFLAALVALACFAGIIVNIYRVSKKNGGKVQETIDKLRISFLFIAAVLVLGYFSPSDIASRRTRSVVTCLGYGFSKVIGHIQLAHCAGDEFFQWRKSFLFTSFALIFNTLSRFVFGECLVGEDMMLNIALIVNIASYWHYILSITQQLTRVLDVKVFSIKPKEKAKAN